METEKTLGRKKLEAPHSFLLIYPNSFYLGMSNLGYHSVLSLVDSQPEWYSERAFSGSERSLDKNRTFSSFDVVAFSIAYELDYINLPLIFRQGRLPLRSSQRDERHPLIIAGGAALLINPEPIADFIDVIVFGEAEEALPAILELVAEEKTGSRDQLLRKLAAIKGVYVPKFYKYRFDQKGRISGTAAEKGFPLPIEKNWLVDLESYQTVSYYVTSQTVFSGRALIEIGRGCVRQCRFCATGYLFRPMRTRSAKAIYAAAEKLQPLTCSLGLISPTVSDHPQINTIAPRLIEKGFSLSVSSLRAESVSTPLLEALVASRQKMVTLAPEAGSLSLRKRMNKDMEEEIIAGVLNSARRVGLQRAKLYFLVGLPGETNKDIEEIVSLTQRLSSFLPLSISVNPFIPKPHTPLQWSKLDRVDSLKGKLWYLRSELYKIGGIKVRLGSVREAVRQACLSRGDRRMGQVIEEGDWSTAKNISNPFRLRKRSEFFPWSIFSSGVKEEYLWEEYQKAKTG